MRSLFFALIPVFSLAYDRGWRVRTDWKQYQLLKQYVEFLLYICARIF